LMRAKWAANEGVCERDMKRELSRKGIWLVPGRAIAAASLVAAAPPLSKTKPARRTIYGTSRTVVS
jgi:hypothetical protein